MSADDGSSRLPMFYLSKILPFFVLPTGVVLMLLIAGIVLRRRAPLVAAVAVLWVCGTPIVGDVLTQTIERGYTRTNATTAPVADAVVVLSSSRVVAPGPDKVSEWADADRFFGGFELFVAGRAPWLVFTGGWMPWEPHAPLEGDVLKEYAVRLGVPADRIVTTGRVLNTEEEADAVRGELTRLGLTMPRVLLVTSASHMPRATHLFERAGIRVVPFAVDFRSSEAAEPSLLRFVPAAWAFARTEAAIRELYGRWFYALLALG